MYDIDRRVYTAGRRLCCFGTVFAITRYVTKQTTKAWSQLLAVLWQATSFVFFLCTRSRLSGLAQTTTIRMAGAFFDLFALCNSTVYIVWLNRTVLAIKLGQTQQTTTDSQNTDPVQNRSCGKTGFLNFSNNLCILHKHTKEHESSTQCTETTHCKGRFSEQGLQNANPSFDFWSRPHDLGQRFLFVNWNVWFQKNI